MNVPNALTTLRFLLIGVFLYLFQAEGNYTAAAIVFIVAGITDILDGAIARKYNIVTDFGKLADPLADKLMLIAALFCLVSVNILPVFILVFVLAKEFTLVIASAFLYKKQQVVVYAKRSGKIAAVLFNLGVVLSFLYAHINMYPIHLVVFAAAIICGIIAFIQYANSFWRNRNDSHDKSGDDST